VNSLKKYPLIILTILLLSVLSSGCIFDNGNKTNQTKNYTQNGISFDYPGQWGIANTTVNNTIVAVADPASIDPNTGFATTVAVIQKLTLPSGSNMADIYNRNYEALFNNSSHQRISEGNITLDSLKAFENVYTLNENGIQKQQRALWIENNHTIYVILCSAKVTDFNNEKQNFDMIIYSFKIQ